jgi:integrase
MPSELPTRDDTLSSRPTIESSATRQAMVVIPLAPPPTNLCRAVNCKHDPTGAVEAYVEAGIAPATRRAYRADLDHFEAWGGTLPATDTQVTNYLADHATVLKVATLTRRLAAISVAHKVRGLPNPAATPLVRATMRGIRRAHGATQHQAKPLLREDLFVVLGAMGDRLKDLRDRALLLIGFAGGLRRSELSAINFTDFERVREGIILTIRRSKTDQDGVGRKIGIPFGRTIHCPVRALENWLSRAGRRRSRIPARRSTRASLGRSTLGRSRVLDPPRSDGCRRVRLHRVFRPQPARRLRDERDSGGRFDVQD